MSLQPKNLSCTPVGAILAFAALVTVFLAYAALWWSMPQLPFLDFPNHLARATIMSDLLFSGGQQFGDEFSLHLQAVPYVLGDLALAALVWLFSPVTAGRIWVILSFASLPIAVAVFAKLQRFRAPAITIAVLLSFYLATDWFFMSGFMSFRLAAAFALVAIGLVAHFLDEGPSLPGWAAYSGLLVAAYLTHLTPLLFVTVAAGALVGLKVLRRQLRVATAVLIGAPLAALWVFYLASKITVMDGAVVRGGFNEKIIRLVMLFSRFDFVTEAVLATCFGLLCLLLSRRVLRSLAADRVLEYIALAAAFVAVYAVLPKIRGTMFEIDVRALPYAWIFAMFAALAIWEANPSDHTRLFTSAAALLAILNLSVIAINLRPHDAALRDLRAVGHCVPPHGRVRPLNTIRAENSIQPYAHAGSWATIDRQALTPYLFGGDANDSMTYFRYRHRPPAPWMFKCTLGDCKIDWSSLLRDYDFVLVTGAEGRSAVKVPTEVIATSGPAALLKFSQ